MIRDLKIGNFKCWSDTGTIRMSPITLFFGTNSSGKSSIGQFLMMLRQTVDSPDRKAVFYTGGKNSAVQLGSYQDMVYQRDSGASISFDYTWDLASSLKIKDPISLKSFTGTQLEFAAVAGMKDEGQKTLILNQLKYILKDDEETALSIQMALRQTTRIEYEVDAENYTLVRNQGRAWYPKSPVRFYGFPDEVVAYYQNAAFVQELNLVHENLFRSLCYLGPLRTKAERLYSWTGTEPEQVGYSGENTVAAMLAAKNRKISFGYKQTAKPFQQLIAEELTKMGLIERFQVNAISKQRQEYEVKVCTKGSEDWVDLPDVGFGVSQVLPVLVQCFYAPRNSIIIMEQPEIHLHPSAQAALADVMIDVMNSREDGSDRNIQLIVETHSEHFLRRLQRRIAEGTISTNKVSAYFSDVSKMPARLDTLQIDMFGNIMNWPENFFGDDMGDITAQAKAAMEKRIDQTSDHADTPNG
ncbi:MAG: DUF3696 domain-containing protein [candidate division Zixibacteria bacterium]|nr:DUF3696 domain-containing protein [candidate division Zixibacteria bacterium]MDH3938610.1 DUF3696 domain-containing protein [candidate division Zixibacteria bacterium]MDH4033944.1 DUF3696 domain-containing protein [candidate division Zixibacteria bacterium]